MIAKAMPILLLAGGALALAARRKSPSPKLEPTPMPGPDPELQRRVWLQRQESLQFLASEGLCPPCDPGDIDGIWGPNTVAGIKGFQEFAGLPMSGDWTLDTGAKMREFLRSLGEDPGPEPDLEPEPQPQPQPDPNQYVGSGWTDWPLKSIFPNEASFLSMLKHLGYSSGSQILSDETREEVMAFQGDFNEVLGWSQANSIFFKNYSPVEISGLIDAATVDALWQAQSMQDTTWKEPWPQIVAQTQG
jgi:peptidoglycan hydrolase-like protein with peptidoglycan-binding domain